jgi:hypothetical protein
VSDQEWAELFYLRELEQAVTSLLEGYIPSGRLSLCLPGEKIDALWEAWRDVEWIRQHPEEAAACREFQL